MSQQQLPPYSTFRTCSKQLLYPQAQSDGNLLAFTPPGFKQTLWIKFPDSRLAVCPKCKKNFKTRELCRVRNRHSAAPWTSAYICLTIDDSCLDEEGKFVDEEMTVRMVQWQPYCVKKDFNPKTPVCASCKKTNRTRSFCRQRHKHRLLPWNTVYMLLSTLKSVDPSTVVAKAEDAYNPNYGFDEASTKSDNSKGEESVGISVEPSPNIEASSSTSAPVRIVGTFNDADTISSDNEDNGDDIFDVPESRTLLAIVSSRATSIHWLELGQALNEPIESKPETAQASDYASLFDGLITGYRQNPQQQPNQQQSNQQQSLQQQSHQQQQQHALKLRQQQQFIQMQQLHNAQARWHLWPSHQILLSGQGESATAGEVAAAQHQQQAMADGQPNYGAMALPLAYTNPGQQHQLFSTGGSENLPVNSGQQMNFQDFPLGPEEPSTKRRRSG